jgi:hypothetical protein
MTLGLPPVAETTGVVAPVGHPEPLRITGSEATEIHAQALARRRCGSYCGMNSASSSHGRMGEFSITHV